MHPVAGAPFPARAYFPAAGKVPHGGGAPKLVVMTNQDNDDDDAECGFCVRAGGLLLLGLAGFLAFIGTDMITGGALTGRLSRQPAPMVTIIDPEPGEDMSGGARVPDTIAGLVGDDAMAGTGDDPA